MKNILIILGHPDKESLCGKLADFYEKGAESSDAEVLRINLGDLKFDPILWNGYAKVQKLEPDLVRAQRDIKWADHLVFVYPNWWGSFPALMKGFFERVFLPGFAYKYKGPITVGLLKKKTARFIITMGEPLLLYKFSGRLAEKTLKKSILRFCGIKKIKTTLFGSVDNAKSKKRKRWLKKVYKIGKKLK